MKESYLRLEKSIEEAKKDTQELKKSLDKTLGDLGNKLVFCNIHLMKPIFA
jgi:hypothetical protein